MFAIVPTIIVGIISIQFLIEYFAWKKRIAKFRILKTEEMNELTIFHCNKLFNNKKSEDVSYVAKLNENSRKGKNNSLYYELRYYDSLQKARCDSKLVEQAIRDRIEKEVKEDLRSQLSLPTYRTQGCMPTHTAPRQLDHA